MDLGKIIIKDINKVLSHQNMKHVLEGTNKLYKESMEQLNLEAKNPDGKVRSKLNPQYAKKKSKQSGASTGFANFVLTGRAKKSLKGTVATSANSLDIFYHFTDDQANEYMYINEISDPYKKERRQFPLERDTRSSRQKDNIKFVGLMIQSLLTKERRIIVPQESTNELVKV